MPSFLNLAILLSDPDVETLLYNCSGILVQAHSIRPDLQFTPLPDADGTWFTDGISFMQDGRRYAQVAVTTEEEVLWAKSMPTETATKLVELRALTKALELGKEYKVNIYSNQCAFALVHMHGSIYKERGLITMEKKNIKNKVEILVLLKALSLPKKLAIIHCPRHQREDGLFPRGNNLAEKKIFAHVLVDLEVPNLPKNARFTRQRSCLD